MRLRLATPDDAPAIAAIYNQGIQDRVATFETRLRTPQEIEQCEVGVYEKHAQLDGVWRDVVIVERLLPASVLTG
jgi:L-amino acid N-acyltransferase YncA